MPEGPASPEINQGIIDRKFVEVEGTKVSYVEKGNPNGKPFIYIGGWASAVEGDKWFLDALDGQVSNSRGFRELTTNKPSSAASLAEGVKNLHGNYRILDVEIPGSGKSSPLTGEVNIEKVADVVAAFQKQLGAEKAIVFGSSLGGKIAIELARLHPEAVDLLALQGVMTTSSDMDKVTFAATKVASSRPAELFFRIFPKAKTFVFSTAAKGSKDFKMSEPHAQQAMIEGARLVDAGTGIKLLREVGKDIQGDVEQVKCPVLLIDGDQGTLVPFKNTRAIGERFHRDMPSEGRMTREDTAPVIRISNVFGEQGHTVVNSCPEALAVLVHKMSQRLLRERL